MTRIERIFDPFDPCHPREASVSKYSMPLLVDMPPAPQRHLCRM
jgi:hypothetical protein